MAAVPPPPPVPVQFPWTPGQASNVVIDYNSSEGIKLYKLATDPLYSKDEDHFDCSSSGLKDFLELMEIRVFKYTWDNSVLGIPEDSTVANSPVQMLLELHGSISMESIHAHVATYIATPTRAAQDSMQLYECLVKSITKEGRDKVTIWKQDYMVRNPTLPSGYHP
jgi:hypothetical protein